MELKKDIESFSIKFDIFADRQNIETRDKIKEIKLRLDDLRQEIEKYINSFYFTQPIE
jgi:hypothetical protein